MEFTSMYPFTMASIPSSVMSAISSALLMTLSRIALALVMASAENGYSNCLVSVHTPSQRLPCVYGEQIANSCNIQLNRSSSNNIIVDY